MSSFARRVLWSLVFKIFLEFGVWSLVFSALALHAAPAGFRFTDVTTNSLGLWEGTRPVFVYNSGIISKEGVPADRARSSYVHPLYGLDGEVLTDDFPKDHYHHRGLFWAWPHVGVGEQQTDLWMLKEIRHQFDRWLEREAGERSALLGIQNGWWISDKKVVDEKVFLRVWPANADGQAIDIDLTWVPLDKPLTLRGAEGKSYGGLTLRFAPRKDTVITTPEGNSKEDLHIARLPWADLSAQFADAQKPSGAAIFIDPAHPDYPPQWLTRHYGVLCVGWPGVDGRTFQPGEKIRCRYRVWIHRGAADAERLKRAYADYIQEIAAATATSAQWLRAERKPDRLSVSIDGRLFTEYLFCEDEKYPYFYPVNGPATGKTITEKRLPSFPHHSSIFFGSDKVNKGNYWQEGLDRGRIVSKEIRMLRDSGDKIVFEQQCRWQRPGADAPFDDFRHVEISAPNSHTRYIDFDVKLKARIKVRIEKTNHSLFSVRMAPELSATNGGTLINAAGDLNEKGTFGKESPWADFHGTRDGETEGVAILCHPSSKWFASKWFTRDYGFMSPTPLYWPEKDAFEFEPGEEIHLRYRVVVHAGKFSSSDMQAEFEKWSHTQ